MSTSDVRTRPRFTTSFAELRDDVAYTLGQVVYATMTTVDRRGRPRARVLIAVWELEGETPVGWLGTNRTPVKAAHIAHNPHVTLSYWSPRQDVAYVDNVASWVEDPETRARVWSLYERGSPAGVGYDPLPYWPGGPQDPGWNVLRLDPWRVQVLRAHELASGVPSRIWKASEQEDR